MFLEEDFSETIQCIGLKVSEITETVMPFQDLEFLFHSCHQDSDKNVLMRQKLHKDSPIESSVGNLYA